MATQAVDSIQMEEPTDKGSINFFSVDSEVMGRADYISNPGLNNEATIKGPESNKSVDWKKWLIITAAVIASIVIVVLIILVITAYVDSGDSAENQLCLNPPNGLMRLTSGVKILAVDTDPRSIDVSGDGETSQIIALTCKEGKKFVDQNSEEWDLPDQVAFIENLFIGQASVSASIFRTTEELDVYRRAKLGLKIGPIGKIIRHIKASGSWKYYSTQIIQEQQTIVKTFVFIGSYKAVLKSYEGLHFESSVMASFQNLRDCSPSRDPSEFTYEERLDFEECRNAYKDFLDFHGTHYYTQASLGGRAWSYYEVNQTYMGSEKGTQITASAKIAFQAQIGIGGGIDLEDGSDVQQFQSNAEYDFWYKGGRAEFYKNGTLRFEEWRRSVFSYPVSYEHELAPIYFLISQTDPRREIMRDVFEEYIQEKINDTIANE